MTGTESIHKFFNTEDILNRPSPLTHKVVVQANHHMLEDVDLINDLDDLSSKLEKCLSVAIEKLIEITNQLPTETQLQSIKRTISSIREIIGDPTPHPSWLKPGVWVRHRWDSAIGRAFVLDVDGPRYPNGFTFHLEKPYKVEGGWCTNGTIYKGDVDNWRLDQVQDSSEQDSLPPPPPPPPPLVQNSPPQRENERVEEASLPELKDEKICALGAVEDTPWQLKRLGASRYMCTRPLHHGGACGDWLYVSQPEHAEAIRTHRHPFKAILSELAERLTPKDGDNTKTHTHKRRKVNKPYTSWLETW